jgi:nicotinamidase-related amidase
VPDGLAVVDRVNRLAAMCRVAGIQVIHISHVLRPDGSNMGMGELGPTSAGRHHQQGRPISSAR